jgi:hypothetical protein
MQPTIHSWKSYTGRLAAYCTTIALIKLEDYNNSSMTTTISEMIEERRTK